MAEEKPSLHIDTDWKKQAQEEKRRLAEQEAAKAKAAPTTAPAAAPPPVGGAAAPAGAAPARPGGRKGEEVPPASFAALVQSLMTQVLFYLGDIAPRGGQPTINLDMAKHNIDIMAMLEEKTVNNLSEDEKHLLDAALYETRMRYVSVASQYV